MVVVAVPRRRHRGVNAEMGRWSCDGGSQGSNQWEERREMAARRREICAVGIKTLHPGVVPSLIFRSRRPVLAPPLTGVPPPPPRPVPLRCALFPPAAARSSAPCREADIVRRVGFTSSAGTVNIEERQRPFYDHDDWRDIDFCRCIKMTGWKAAMDYAGEHSLGLISVIPTLVVGPLDAISLNTNSFED
uniref:Uncharacterized protein n=1 Tax=Oryza brachyantha TaxID=4533 RepID=J3N931_ORYBR